MKILSAGPVTGVEYYTWTAKKLRCPSPQPPLFLRAVSVPGRAREGEAAGHLWSEAQSSWETLFLIAAIRLWLAPGAAWPAAYSAGRFMPCDRGSTQVVAGRYSGWGAASANPHPPGPTRQLQAASTAGRAREKKENMPMARSMENRRPQSSSPSSVTGMCSGVRHRSALRA